MKSIRHNLNIYRRYPYWKKAKCIYIHIPKAAGTSINNALYGRTLGHYRANEIKKHFPKLYAQCFTFSFVRDPWSRLASAYRFAKVGRTDTMGIFNPRQYEVPEFDSFERFVLEWLPERDVNNLDFVFQPQSSFVVGNEGELIVDYIGRLDDIKKGMQVVSEVTGREIAVPSLNRTLKNGQSNYEVLRKLYCNPIMIDVVAEKYASDISMFDFQFGEY